MEGPSVGLTGCFLLFDSGALWQEHGAVILSSQCPPWGAHAVTLSHHRVVLGYGGDNWSLGRCHLLPLSNDSPVGRCFETILSVHRQTQWTWHLRGQTQWTWHLRGILACVSVGCDDCKMESSQLIISSAFATRPSLYFTSVWILGVRVHDCYHLFWCSIGPDLARKTPSRLASGSSSHSFLSMPLSGTALSAPLLESAISPRSSASCWWGTASGNQELGTKDTRLLLSVVLSVDRAGSWILKPRVHHGARHIATPRGSVPTISPPFLLPTVPSHWGLRNVSSAVLIKVPCNPASQQWFQKLRLFTGCQFSLPPWGWIQPVVSSI